MRIALILLTVLLLSGLVVYALTRPICTKSYTIVHIQGGYESFPYDPINNTKIPHTRPPLETRETICDEWLAI
jgi:hypothetical protein